MILSNKEVDEGIKLVLSFTSSCVCTESMQPQAHAEVSGLLTIFFVSDESVVESSMASADDSSMALVIWAAQPLVTFGQFFIMWLLLAHGRQRPPSMHHCRSWGVSLPSLPSLSIKSLLCLFLRLFVVFRARHFIGRLCF